MNETLSALRTKKGGVISIGLIIVAWQISSYFTPPYLIPSITEIFGKFFEVITHWTFLRQAVFTVARVIVSLLISFFIGAALSILMGYFRKLEEYVLPVLHLIMGVPALSWVVMAIIWIPGVEGRILFILVACCSPNYTLEMYDAIKGIQKDLMDMLLSFRPNRWQLFTKLILPSIVPAMLTSWKINVGYATRVAMVAELVGATTGVGYQLLSSEERFDMAGAIAWTMVLVVFLLIAQASLKKLESWLLRYRPSIG